MVWSFSAKKPAHELHTTCHCNLIFCEEDVKKVQFDSFSHFFYCILRKEIYGRLDAARNPLLLVETQRLFLKTYCFCPENEWFFLLNHCRSETYLVWRRQRIVKDLIRRKKTILKQNVLSKDPDRRQRHLSIPKNIFCHLCSNSGSSIGIEWRNRFQGRRYHTGKKTTGLNTK